MGRKWVYLLITSQEREVDMNEEMNEQRYQFILSLYLIRTQYRQMGLFQPDFIYVIFRSSMPSKYNRSDDDIKAASKNIIMQLRKSVSMKGQKDVEFASGKQKVPPQVAQKILDMYNKQRTSADKSKFQMKIAKSYKDLLTTVKGR